MCQPGPRSHARAMNTSSVNPEDTTTEAGPPAPPPFQPGYPGPERVLLRRSYTDRMLAGVAGGVARYFGVDATIVRIAFVVLTLFGGAGIPVYLAGLLLIPEEGSDQSIAGSLIESLQPRSR
jgi:phage shock protein PspC (stress-responsive transcriptional regulator)